MTITKDQLKPCPFCGDQPMFDGNGDNWQDDNRYVEMRVVCCVEMNATMDWRRARGVRSSEIEEILKEELLQKWNTRFEPVDEETPWYPDNGPWIEFDGTNPPDGNDLVEILCKDERDLKSFTYFTSKAKGYIWKPCTGESWGIVAYKVIA